MSKEKPTTALMGPPLVWTRRRSDRAHLARRAELYASPGWHTALAQFASTTGLAVTLFDMEGQMRAGPYTPTPLTERLSAAGCWDEPDGVCLAKDREAARACTEQGNMECCEGLETLALFAIPARLKGDVIGAIVAGWVFDNFPDPIVTDRLAKRINVSFPELWQIVRQQPPVSREKLKIYAEMLQTLSDSFVQERAETLHEQAQARELVALNQSALALAAATCIEEIGAAVVEAVMTLTEADGTRLLVVADEGAWSPAAQQGHDISQERRAITSSLRVPVKGADGALLGMIEISGASELAAANAQAQLAALAAQAAVALQKFRLFADLQRERSLLERANRTKDEFLSVLSHELRTPLTPILGWISMLRQRPMPSDQVEDAYEAIERNARQELHLVNEMLDLSRILNDKIHLETDLINPTDALASAFAAAQTMTVERDLHLELEASQNLPHITADPKRLQQALGNLISNAVKFTGDGGHITLGARLGADASVEFFVTDTGVGIRPEALSHIFDRFQQGDSSTTRRYGGLGIGLSVVRGLVEMHGGRAWAESEGEGHGSTFIISFPATKASARRVEEQMKRSVVERSRNAGVGQPSGGARVLVVDDDPDTLTVVRMMLENAGYELETADSVKSALEAARRFVPDVIVSDIGLPEADGFEFLKRVREETLLAAAPVIALTGYATTIDREAVLGAGFAAHLAKPIEPRALVAALDDALNK